MFTYSIILELIHLLSNRTSHRIDTTIPLLNFNFFHLAVWSCCFFSSLIILCLTSSIFPAALNSYHFHICSWWGSVPDMFATHGVFHMGQIWLKHLLIPVYSMYMAVCSTRFLSTIAFSLPLYDKSQISLSVVVLSWNSSTLAVNLFSLPYCMSQGAFHLMFYLASTLLYIETNVSVGFMLFHAFFIYRW